MEGLHRQKLYQM